jgi:hypothetical protein
MSHLAITIPFKAEAETSAPPPHMFSVKIHLSSKTKYSTQLKVSATAFVKYTALQTELKLRFGT